MGKRKNPAAVALGRISGSAPVLTVELHGLVAVERGVLTVEGGQVAGFAVTRARRRGEV